MSKQSISILVLSNKKYVLIFLNIVFESVLKLLYFKGALFSYRKNWMSQLNPRNPLFSISIPGTHDSGTYKISDIIGFGWVTTQDWSIYEQLVAGIRFLDIRCRHIKNVCQVYHGDWSAHINFDEVLSQVIRFLNERKGETVIMRLVEQSNGNSNTRTFEDTFNLFYTQYKNYFWQ